MASPTGTAWPHGRRLTQRTPARPRGRVHAPRAAHGHTRGAWPCGQARSPRGHHQGRRERADLWAARSGANARTRVGEQQPAPCHSRIDQATARCMPSMRGTCRAQSQPGTCRCGTRLRTKRCARDRMGPFWEGGPWLGGGRSTRTRRAAGCAIRWRPLAPSTFARPSWLGTEGLRRGTNEPHTDRPPPGCRGAAGWSEAPPAYPGGAFPWGTASYAGSAWRGQRGPGERVCATARPRYTESSVGKGGNQRASSPRLTAGASALDPR